MKRVVAFSDSHGSVNDLRDAFLLAAHAGVIDALVFLGDGDSDWRALEPLLRAQCPNALLFSVRGNNDWRSTSSASEVFTVGGVRFYACHGHEWHVKYSIDRLYYAAREVNADVALFGHTHRSALELEHGMYLINPGAVCMRMARKPAYADVRIGDDGGVRPSFGLWE